MTSLQTNKRGFTIVELLIVIVVIGILALLVITTFTGVQQKARNTKRTTDIKAIQAQAEAYYASNGMYPTMANINDSNWRSTNMKGLESQALCDPVGNGCALVAAPAANVYAYAATPNGCDNGANGNCTGYTLTATYEGGGTFVRTALN